MTKEERRKQISERGNSEEVTFHRVDFYTCSNKN